MEVKIFKGKMQLNGGDDNMQYIPRNIPFIDRIGKLGTFRANFTKLIAPLIKIDNTENVDLIREADRIIDNNVLPIINNSNNDFYNNYNDNDTIDIIYKLLFLELYRLGIRASLNKSNDNEIVKYINSNKDRLYTMCESLL